MKKTKRLLFITSNRLGDAVLSTGILAEALFRYEPESVTIACGPIPTPLFQAVPNLERIIILDKKEKGGHWLKCWLATVPHLWDVVIDIRNSIVSYTIPAKKVFRFMGGDAATHKTAQLATMFNVPEIPYSKIWLSEKVAAEAEKMMPAGAPILALCPTTNWEHKQWPAKRFAECAHQLGFSRIALFGAAHERPQVEQLLLDLSATHTVIDLIGKTDPLQAAACLSRAALCIANDSGLMHIAAAVGTPTLGIFGPSNDAEYAPHGPRTAFVRGAPFHGLENTPNPSALMHAVTVDMAVAKAKELMRTS